MRLPMLPCRTAAVPFIVVLSGLALSGSALAAPTSLVCSIKGKDEVAARIEDPWSDAPLLQGMSGPMPVTKFVRGSTVIFDARREVLYFDTGNHAFAYTSVVKGGPTLRGTCEEGS